MEIPVAIRTIAKMKNDERYSRRNPTRIEVGLKRVIALRDQQG
jgi:hypothetical protein